mmetsp:Transcript_35282/g.140203  ORF Transcript_35282/g.140203 Transcript_35282/m.140203 type:complete len:131 (+) Transcript_35282:761-1153(+)
MFGSDGEGRGMQPWLSQNALRRLDRFLTFALITLISYKVGVYADYRMSKRRKQIAQEILEETKPRTSPSAFLEPEFDVHIDAEDMAGPSQEDQEKQVMGNSQDDSPAEKENPGSLRLLDEIGRLKRRLAP